MLSDVGLADMGPNPGSADCDGGRGARRQA